MGAATFNRREIAMGLVGVCFLLAARPCALGQNPPDSACQLEKSDLLQDARLTPEQKVEIQRELRDPSFLPSQSFAWLHRELVPVPPEIEQYRSTHSSGMFPGGLAVQFRDYSMRGHNFTDEFMMSLALALEGKEGAALREGADMIGHWHPQSSESFGKPLPCAKQAMAAVFPRLDDAEQIRLLQEGSVKMWVSNAMARHLERLYSQIHRFRPDGKDLIGSSEGGAIIAALNLVDASAARAMVVKEASAPYPSVGIEGLGVLADDSLPELDSILLRQMRAAYDDDFWNLFQAKLRLVERYASPAILEDVKQFYLQDDDWGFRDRALFFSYFLRVAPDFGADLIRKTLKDRNSKDRDTLLTDIKDVRSALAYQPVALATASRLEPIAEEMISRTEGDIAGDAGSVIQEFAKADFEPVLWHELRAWCDRWCSAPRQDIPFSESSRRDGIVEALLYNRSWIMTPEKLTEIHNLARTDESAVAAVHDMPSPTSTTRITALRNADGVQIIISYSSYSSIDDALNHIRRAPAGEFVWDSFVGDLNDPEIRRVYEALKSEIKANGSTLRLDPVH